MTLNCSIEDISMTIKIDIFTYKIRVKKLNYKNDKIKKY